MLSKTEQHIKHRLAEQRKQAPFISMASLTPGLLEKLLVNAGNKDVKVTGEHRSALLQVLEILPSLAGAGADDPWQSRGFFLKVSDSLHSAYVSVQDEDMDLIYSDKIQLGQFVYISGLDSGSPVPFVRGLKPVPKRRPCVGNPKDLVSSELLNPKGNTRCKNNDLKKNALEGLELRRLSLDSARRIWDQTPTPKSSSTSFNSNLRTSNNVNSRKKAASKNDPPLKPPILSISPLKSKTGVSSPKHIAKPQKKDFRSPACTNIPSCLVKVPISTKACSEEKISWNTLPPAIHNLGKDIMHHRNVASLAAARALEEASAAESVILCLQAFGDLCGSSQNISSGPLVEQYLDLHQNMQRAATVVKSLLIALPGGPKSSFYNKNAAYWVHAAIETNLSKFILFKKPEKGEENTDTCHCVVLGSIKEELNSENQSPPKKQSPQNHRNMSDSIPKVTSLLKNSSAAKAIHPKKDIYPKEAGLRETASLAEKLLLHSRQWFLKYMENSLSNGFQFCIGEASEISCLLRQLNRVNQWLDGLTGGDNGKVQDLRKKIYRFLLAHADSAGK
ncbi:uncharacterized protein [Euphorbia lathyris]|uniref:uncharacterized protein n=1 Tax=Euphorbia lathyris TaxID=212925 RepID=UPI003313C57D